MNGLTTLVLGIMLGSVVANPVKTETYNGCSQCYSKNTDSFITCLNDNQHSIVLRGKSYCWKTIKLRCNIRPHLNTLSRAKLSWLADLTCFASIKDSFEFEKC